MPAPRLPDAPVLAWRESRSPWWAFGPQMWILDGFEYRRELSISRNGLSVDNRFLPWPDIEGIVDADDPDLATICLAGGDVLRLDRWNLPFRGAEKAKAERLDVLHRAFAASRAQD